MVRSAKQIASQLKASKASAAAREAIWKRAHPHAKVSMAEFQANRKLTRSKSVPMGPNYDQRLADRKAGRKTKSVGWR